MKQFEKFPYGNLFASKSHEPAIELSEKLVELSPFDDAKVFFLGSSGSDANDTQIKLMWYLNNALDRKKKKKISIKGAGNLSWCYLPPHR